MTSECFVYITLPEQTEPVTAGKFVLTKNRQGISLGKFIYGKSYLSRPDAVAFDPVELKLVDKTYETVALKGVFGALRDAGPDYWGRRIIERHAGKAELGELDYLLNSPDDGAGALGFGLNVTPPAPKRTFNQTLDLAKLQEIADIIVRDEGLPARGAEVQALDLMLAGTSMGGARPKAVVEDKDGLWLAKFNRPDDKWNAARVEHAMLVLARSCGLHSAESKLTTIGDRDALLVKRFDREKTETGYTRARMISALTLLQTEDTHQSRDKWSYVLLVEELRRASARAQDDAQELFRRMVFNALISNNDDHPRNHALLAKDKEWRLSPAYDLTPAPLISQERRDLALICGDYGRIATAQNMLSQARRFMLDPDEAENIVKAMMNTVQYNWHKILRSAGVSEQDCATLAGAFVYSGFFSDEISSVRILLG